jgi:transcriptional regulator
MYTPDHFSCEDKETAFRLIEEFPLSTVICPGKNQPEIAVAPVYFVRDSMELLGHFAKNNPIVNVLDGAKTTFMFHGPQAFISPSWYETKPHLPTWNYAVVTLDTTTTITPRPDQNLASASKMTEYFEDDNVKSYMNDPDYQSLIERASAGIVSFRAKIQSINTKLKLSQNKSVMERRLIVKHLRNIGTSSASQMADLMETDIENDTP